MDSHIRFGIGPGAGTLGRRRPVTLVTTILTSFFSAGLAICAAPAPASAQTYQNVCFLDGNNAENIGRLYRPSQPPAGYKPPAVVLMHGCTGMWSNSSPPTISHPAGVCTVGQGTVAQSHIEKWGRRLAAEGYLALAIDGYTTRADNSQNHCGESPPFDPATEVDPYTTRAFDFYVAKSYLANQRNANPAGIGVLGWSQGAESALVTAAATPRNNNVVYCPPPWNSWGCLLRPALRPAAAVVFYPGCGANLGYGYSGGAPGYWRPDVPIRWNHGEDDATTAFGPCEDRVDRAVSTYGASIDFDHYDNVGHSFDMNTVADDGSLYAFATVKCTAAQQMATPTRCARWDADIDSLAFITSQIHGSF
jgi:dienelactone hydrolase